jgi:NADPH:quinone reductase-like Zn-dependent oxidoreductase
LVETPAEQAVVLSLLIEQANTGALHVPIGAILPLAEAATAHRNILDRKVEGKQVLDCQA